MKIFSKPVKLFVLQFAVYFIGWMAGSLLFKEELNASLWISALVFAGTMSIISPLINRAYKRRKINKT